jgi:Flp pilus assembly protein TadB
MEEHKLKPFKLRRPLLVGERPTGIIVPWQVWLVFCAIVIIVAGIVSWFHPWFGLPAAYIVITILIFAWLFRYQSQQK